MQKTQDWSGVWALWRGLKRVAAVLALAIVGGICGGLVAGLLTVWVYGLGIYLGVPAGFCYGGFVGRRTAPRDAALVFALALAGGEIGLRLAARQTSDGLVLFAAWGASYLLSTLVAFGAGPRLPVRIRYPLAVAATWGLGLFTSFCLVRSLWFST